MTKINVQKLGSCQVIGRSEHKCGCYNELFIIDHYTKKCYLHTVSNKDTPFYKMLKQTHKNLDEISKSQARKWINTKCIIEYKKMAMDFFINQVC